ncbi:asparagine synthase (glutamine-hydrolyzing), partial [bacterium]|nr:asparagine synthase (glutamine-hydrolyzing) [bacterium]
MCGFAGIMSSASGRKLSDDIHRMISVISHRGPDDYGIWLDDEANIALGHRRLAVVDLTDAGHQPMRSLSGRYVMVYNGEIYNHNEIRKKLDNVSDLQSGGVKWNGKSDTETLLAAFEAWGVEATLKASVGMFAIALWDRRLKRLILARDRFGEKPLYYGWQNGVFIFGSELKVLQECAAFRKDINRDALAMQLMLGYIPAPYTIFNKIKKLPSGTMICVDMQSQKVDQDPIEYWSLLEVAERGQSNIYVASDIEAVEMLEKYLRQAISQQMLSDVPLGAFLSGGIDSSTVVALMQTQSSTNINTFTIGFCEEAYNEAVYAKKVSRYLGTKHTELYVSPQQVLQVVPQLPLIYDEPFSDSSQIPTILLSKLTRQHVTVALSGDAGDELFGGYNRYIMASKLRNRYKYIPNSLKLSISNLFGLIPEKIIENSLGILGIEDGTEKIRKMRQVITATSKESIYRKLISHWENPCDLVIGVSEASSFLSLSNISSKIADFEHQMMIWDILGYLTDDILVKVDRASMAMSLETRLPFLDHRVVDFAWHLPINKKIRNGQGKWILRQVLYKYVPKEIIDRPKKGFAVPIANWLRGPLRDWAEALIDESRLHREGYFNPDPIRKTWKDHITGKRNGQH